MSEARFSYIFASELHERLLWFARLRWLAAGALAVASVLGPRLGFDSAWPGLVVVAALVAGYNLVFLSRLRGLDEQPDRYANLRAGGQGPDRYVWWCSVCAGLTVRFDMTIWAAATATTPGIKKPGSPVVSATNATAAIGVP